MAALTRYRLIAAVLAVLVTAGIIAAIVAGTGQRGLSGSGRSAPALLHDRYCGDAQWVAGAPGDQPHAGRYSNPLYGYAVTIPPGLTGYTRAGAAPRGFDIVLSAAAKSRLSVDAAYDALYDVTAAGVHISDSVDVRLFDRLVADQAEPASLARVDGGRYRMQVACPKDAQVHVFEDVIVVRNREIYRLELQSVPARLAQDEPLLDAMVRSWSWVR